MNNLHFKKIYENDKKVSIWVDIREDRKFDRCYVGRNIAPVNIERKTFVDPVHDCQTMKGFNDALKEFKIKSIIERKEKEVRRELKKYCSFYE